ncbi:hypothetical protein Dimus_030024 [Dionaea muscipula]
MLKKWKMRFLACVAYLASICTSRPLDLLQFAHPVIGSGSLYEMGLVTGFMGRGGPIPSPQMLGEVPFVPFPPGYFAQDMQRQTSDSTKKSVAQTSPTPKASEPTGLVVQQYSWSAIGRDEHHPAGAMSPYPTHAEVDSRRAVIGQRSSPSSGYGSSQPAENPSIKQYTLGERKELGGTRPVGHV